MDLESPVLRSTPLRPSMQLLPKKHVDFLVINIGIHLHIWCDFNSPCIRKMYQGPVTQFMKRLMGSGRVGKVLWRMTYPGRNPSSPRAPVNKFIEDGVDIVASTDPLPSSPPPSKALDGATLLEKLQDGSGIAGGEAVKGGDYAIELDAMTSPAMKALGVEVIDSAAMMAYRSDAHTEEKRDRSSSAHSCLPGPIDDVNSLILNRVCFGR